MAQESKSKPLLAALLCLMITKGNCVCLRCMNDYVDVGQQLVEDDHSKVVVAGVHTVYTFRVTVTNRCCCEVSNVVVAARGFRSAIPVDPKLFRRIPGEEEKNYLVGDGKTILNNGSGLTFFYAWSTVFRMDVISMTVSKCW
uniref:Uncharacterized protein n=1 Tax=Oryza punctata TaxID=4537 RepID=A0A0E0MM81_ORYPU